MNTRQDDDNVLKRPVPKGVGESPQESTASAAVPIGVCKWIVRYPGDDGVHYVAELTPETRLLLLVPVLDSRQVELGGSADEDGEGQ